MNLFELTREVEKLIIKVRHFWSIVELYLEYELEKSKWSDSMI